jgi:hypothetical protein
MLPPELPNKQSSPKATTYASLEAVLYALRSYCKNDNWMTCGKFISRAALERPLRNAKGDPWLSDRQGPCLRRTSSQMTALWLAAPSPAPSSSRLGQ